MATNTQFYPRSTARVNRVCLTTDLRKSVSSVSSVVLLAVFLGELADEVADGRLDPGPDRLLEGDRLARWTRGHGLYDRADAVARRPLERVRRRRLVAHVARRRE